MKKRSGSELRDTVAGLLQIKFNNVETEKRLTATTADIYYIEDSSTFPLKIAIECKDWNSALSSSQIADIFNLYKPSISNGEIDKLLIISRHELGQQPSDTVSKMLDMRYLQYDAFVHSLMNFHLLLQNNIAAFKNHEAALNFIQPRCKNTTSATYLKDAVYQWLKLKDRPVAMIYGGYGLGKTSFSHYLASQLSEQYRNNEFKRIPIRIPLGGLFTKQDLKGLICSELTGAEGQPAVGNFTYELFVQMVRQGGILLILDGFDEMKHAMSIEDFEFTFEQMSPLFQGKSKAVILGRPDAFFDNEEEEKIISSLLVSTGALNDNVSRLEVDQFSHEEIDGYLANFCENGQLTVDEKNFINNLKEQEYEILARPVQISMFTKIISALSKSSSTTLTRYGLYSEFVKQFALREEQKPARSMAAEDPGLQLGYNDPRSKFMQNIAWWILTEHKENRFLPTDIPDQSLPNQLNSKKGKLTSVREALVGSVVEHAPDGKSDTGLIGMKGANYYYFPHKSYIEFLVSQYFCRKDFTKKMYRNFFSSANPEMISFVSEGPNLGAQNIALGLEHVLGNVPREIIKIGAGSKDLEQELGSGNYRELSSPRKYLAYENLLQNNQLAEIEKLLLNSITNARTNKSISSSFILLGDYILKHQPEEFITRIISVALTNISDVILQELVLGNRTENHLDTTFVYCTLLSRCLRINSKKSWSFKPSLLVANGAKIAGNSMRCDDYGKYDGKILRQEIDFTPIAVQKLSNDGLQIPKRQLIADFFQLKLPPRLYYGGRAAEYIR